MTPRGDISVVVCDALSREPHVRLDLRLGGLTFRSVESWRSLDEAEQARDRMLGGGAGPLSLDPTVF